MNLPDKDGVSTDLLRLFGRVESYIASDYDEICEAIRNNPVYDNIVLSNDGFEVKGNKEHGGVEQLADEVIGFCGALLDRLRALRKDKYKTAEMLDCLFWAFPIKGDTTLDNQPGSRLHFVELLRNKGYSDEEVVGQVNSLPLCCAAIVENVLFNHISIDYTFLHAYNHLRVCRNCRDGIGGHELLEVDEDKLKALIYAEETKSKTSKVNPQSRFFGLKLEYRKQEKEFIEKLYSLLNEQTIPYISDETDIDTFRAVLLTRDHTKESKQIRWQCDTREVYYITQKLMRYIDGLTFEHFGKLCISKRGIILKNLVANKTDEPRRKSEINSIFDEFDTFLY